MLLATVNNMKKLRKAFDAPICAPGLVAWSEITGEEYSASPGDYWFIDNGDEPLVDAENNPMVLAWKQSTYNLATDPDSNNIADDCCSECGDRYTYKDIDGGRCLSCGTMIC